MFVFIGVLAASIAICLLDIPKLGKIKKRILTKPGTLAWICFFAAVFVRMITKNEWIFDQFVRGTVYLMLGSIGFKMVCGLIGVNFDKKLSEEEDEKLPKKVKGRVKIIQKFNTKYSLNLTEKQINNIAEGSFLSDEWADEIRAMNSKYQTISEWYAGETGWLRAYLKAFNVQSVVPDSEYQRKICIENFDQIFSYVDSINCNDIGECVKMVNDKYLTNFDELSFMLAFRFLEKNERYHRLPGARVNTGYSELEELTKKYEESSSGGSSAYGTKMR